MKPMTIFILDRKGKKVSPLLPCLLVLTAFAASAFADYQISWSTVDNGGGQSSGGQYVLLGTVGQPDAEYSAGGSYEVLGGFLGGGPLSIINFLDFSRFSKQWLLTGCGSGNNWCSGADLDKLGSVGISDLKILCDQWLAEEPEGWPLQ